MADCARTWHINSPAIWLYVPQLAEANNKETNECSTFEWNPKVTTWWRHQMETFSALLAIRVGNSPVPGEFPTQRPVTRSFDVSLICTWINNEVNNREAGD